MAIRRDPQYILYFRHSDPVQTHTLIPRGIRIVAQDIDELRREQSSLPTWLNGTPLLAKPSTGEIWRGPTNVSGVIKNYLEWLSQHVVLEQLGSNNSGTAFPLSSSLAPSAPSVPAVPVAPIAPIEGFVPISGPSMPPVPPMPSVPVPSGPIPVPSGPTPVPSGPVPVPPLGPPVQTFLPGPPGIPQQIPQAMPPAQQKRKANMVQPLPLPDAVRNSQPQMQQQGPLNMNLGQQQQPPMSS